LTKLFTPLRFIYIGGVDGVFIVGDVHFACLFLKHDVTACTN